MSVGAANGDVAPSGDRATRGPTCFGWVEWLAAVVAAWAAAATVAVPTTLASAAAQVNVVIRRRPWSRTEIAAHAGIRRFRFVGMQTSLRGELLNQR